MFTRLFLFRKNEKGQTKDGFYCIIIYTRIILEVLHLENLIIDLNYEDGETIYAIFGEDDSHLKTIEQFYGIHLKVEAGCVYCDEPSRVPQLQKVFQRLVELFHQEKTIETSQLIALLNDHYYKRFITNGVGNKKYYLRTTGQAALYDAYENSVITFAIGPAGTGKTFLAVCHAYQLLKKGMIRKIIITRPVVESGESLGFLPGDLKEKIDPYLRPIYDSFEALVGKDKMDELLQKGVLEIAPLAYMRGRTLNDACIILDEAQNTTQTQIKMFMTRLGFQSKMIITGDISQIDLPPHKKSGLVQAIHIVKDIEGISIVYTNKNDVVRHPIVQKIIEAYQEKE